MRILQLVSGSRIMKGVVLRWLGGGWEKSERDVQTLEVIQLWENLPLTGTEAAVARGDCFA